jgi:hypothetical protein
MGSNMGRVLAAGTAVALFVIALIMFMAFNDRLAGAAALGGLVFMSLAILAHVNDLPRH